MKGITRKEFLKQAKERGITVHRGNNVPKPRKRPSYRYDFWVSGGDNKSVYARNLKDARQKAVRSLEIEVRRVNYH